MTLKLVYYGPGLSGKTTNLATLSSLLGKERDMLALDTADDRTLFFDVLALEFGADRCAVRIQLFTVPGQAIHRTARRMVLAGADGIAFIADSRRAEVETNAESFTEMTEHLRAHGLELRDLPLVIQFNKRDLPKIRSDKELHALAASGREPVYPAVASRGDGVVATFVELLVQVWRKREKTDRIHVTAGIDVDELGAVAARELGGVATLQELQAMRYGGAA
ncbi:GTPase domain-containing protein [Desulfobulbus sp. AH-315-M07]|nr:GTPase domain-containing protein [Desulfobulbus sp. AH-315-M07]